MNNEIHPVGRFLTCEPLPEQSTTKGGIILTSTVNREKERMRILRVGEGTEDKKPYLKPGQVCYVRKGAGSRIQRESGLVIIVHEDNVKAYEDGE